MRFGTRIFGPLFAVLFAALAAATAQAQSSSELLALVRERHKIATETIRTLSAEVVAERVQPEAQSIAKGKYWREFDVVRIDQITAGKNCLESHLLKDGENRSVGRKIAPDGKFGQTVASKETGNSLLALTDLWSDLILDFFDSNMNRLDYGRLLDRAVSTAKARREKLEGIDCIRVDFKLNHGGERDEPYAIWHDVGQGYLIRKMVKLWDTTNGGRSEWEVTRFDTFAEGIPFPVEGRFRAYLGDKLTEERRTKLDRVVVNKPLASGVLDLPRVPSGTLLHDFLDGTRYPINANWEATGPKESNPVVRQVTSSSGSSDYYPTQSTEEPKSWTPWLIGLSILLFVAALVAGTVRKKKRSAVEE